MFSRTHVQISLVLLAALLSACDWVLNYQDDPNYCLGLPNNNCLSAGPTSCRSDQDCAGDTLVCDTAGTMSCVQCTAEKDAACTGAMPVCGDDHTCRSCTAHAQCGDSNVCLPDGSCADAGQVAYVEPAPGGTDNSSCTRATPCTVIAKAVTTGRPYVKLAGTTNEQVTLNNRNVTLLAEPGAKLTATSNGILLRIDGTSQVAIYDLEISGASGSSGFGISISSGATAMVRLTRVKVSGNQAGGISASGGTLAVSQSTISDNIGGGISASGVTLTVSQSTISGNAGGGISVGVNGTFAIVGNVFFENGAQAGTVGGVSISTAQNAANRLEFNSFNKNATTDGFGPAIQCMVGGAFVARNNVMSENGTLTNMNQVGGTCTHTHSIVRPGTLPPGEGNSSADPLFVNTTTGDLHVRAGSPVLGAADPRTDLTGLAARDIDGDVRTVPADIGADEVP